MEKTNLILSDNFISDIEQDFNNLQKIIEFISYLNDNINNNNDNDIHDENDYEKNMLQIYKGYQIEKNLNNDYEQGELDNILNLFYLTLNEIINKIDKKYKELLQTKLIYKNSYKYKLNVAKLLELHGEKTGKLKEYTTEFNIYNGKKDFLSNPYFFIEESLNNKLGYFDSVISNSKENIKGIINFNNNNKLFKDIQLLSKLEQSIEENKKLELKDFPNKSKYFKDLLISLYGKNNTGELVENEVHQRIFILYYFRENLKRIIKQKSKEINFSQSFDNKENYNKSIEVLHKTIIETEEKIRQNNSVKLSIELSNLNILSTLLNSYIKINNNLADINFISRRTITFKDITQKNYLENTLHIPSFEGFEKLK